MTRKLFLFTLFCLISAGSAPAQTWVTLANPNWNITLTDYGYSDFLLDNTPGFEGREYLSGEWGAAVGYQVVGGTNVPAEWLEPHFIFPDWTTSSRFSIVTPIGTTGVNADGLPIAQSVIANPHLEVTQRFEMLDTVLGTPMGITPASSTGAVAFLHSNRYVMKQTYTIKNISGTSLTNVHLFQFLHGLNSQRGLFDNRAHAGPLSAFRYDTTMAGVDPWSIGVGSSSAGLEDFIGFHASTAPDAREIGHYGIEGNGVDAHSSGKPSDGVHLSIEDNWQTAPYSSRQGTDNFAPAQRWIGGAQRWTLGSLAANQSVSFDVLLTIRTGTRVDTGTGSSGGCNGGSSVAGGFDYLFDDVTTAGSCFGEFSRADDAEIVVRVAAGEFDSLSFPTPSKPAQLWKVEFSGGFAGNVTLTLAYDPTILPAGFDESTLAIFQFAGGAWQMLAGTVDTVGHTINVTTDTLGHFALGVDGGTYNITASVTPASSGTATGGGSYATGASATLVATAGPGYVFTNWTESGSVVSSSPNLIFTVTGHRTLVANFTAVGGGVAITTASLPVYGGTTGGGGSYAPGASATVIATPATGYKFSKWLENGVQVSTAASYAFTVNTNRSLVAKFKPVYVIAVTADPPEGGEYEVDAFYEMGEIAKLKAIPFSGYCLVNWTQNGVPVSTATNFTFTVTGNRELVAHFALGHRIDVSAEPNNGGTTTGGGVYGAGDAVTVEAVAKTGYAFLNWTEAGTPVSSSPSYTFTATANSALAANFVALPALAPMAATPETLTLSWPAGGTGWVLQESPDLSPGSWVDSARTVTVIGGKNQVTVPTTASRGFFRLRYP